MVLDVLRELRREERAIHNKRGTKSQKSCAFTFCASHTSSTETSTDLSATPASITSFFRSLGDTLICAPREKRFVLGGVAFLAPRQTLAMLLRMLCA